MKLNACLPPSSLYSTRIAFGFFLLLFCLTVTACDQPDQTLDELTVRRINIVDENGNRQVVLAARERFPLPVLDGREYPRDISPSGIVFYDNEGNEAGGIGVVNVDSVGERVVFAFDYANSEAIALSKFESDDGTTREAGFSMFDRQPIGADIMKVGSVGAQRISITNENGTARIVLRDTKGRPRISMSVDSTDQARIQMLDEEGNVVQGWQ